MLFLILASIIEKLQKAAELGKKPEFIRLFKSLVYTKTQWN